MSREFIEQFFHAQEPPPACTHKPRDAALVQKIEKVAEFASRNGPDFVQLIENKQLHNPDFQFLFGGEGHEYYRWYLYQLLTGHCAESQQPESAQEMYLEGILQKVTLPGEVGQEFVQLLGQLDGSKDTMRSCQHYFMRYASMAEELAKLLYYHVLQLRDMSKQLDVVYLIHDILMKSQDHSSDREFRQITDSCQIIIGGVFAAILVQGKQDDDVYRRLSKFFGSWEDHDIFGRRTIEAFEQAMRSGAVEMAPLSHSDGRTSHHSSTASDRRSRSNEGSRRRHHRSDNWDQKTAHSSKHSSSVLPPHMASSSRPSSSHAAHAWGPAVQEQGSKGSRTEGIAAEGRSASGNPKTRAAFDPPPEKFSQTEVVDAFSFPPGLIPNLVAEKRRHSFSYCPISSSEIQRAIYPSVVDPNDPYLKSRMEKFYAELDEYRPGMVREHVESRKRKEEEGDVESGTDARRRRMYRTAFSLTEEGKLTATLPDGSFAGEGSDSMHVGLGVHAVQRQTEEEKAFHEYRKLRSDVYHKVVPKGPLPTAPRKT